VIRTAKGWGILHSQNGPLLAGDGTPLIYGSREEADYDLPDDGAKVVRVKVQYGTRRRTQSQSEGGK